MKLLQVHVLTLRPQGTDRSIHNTQPRPHSSRCTAPKTSQRPNATTREPIMTSGPACSYRPPKAPRTTTARTIDAGGTATPSHAQSAACSGTTIDASMPLCDGWLRHVGQGTRQLHARPETTRAHQCYKKHVLSMFLHSAGIWALILPALLIC